MASGNTMMVLFPADGVPPSTAAVYAQHDALTGADATAAEAIPFIAFDDNHNEYIDFYCVMPSNYAGGGITLTFIWGSSATTNNGRWQAAFRLVGDDDEDLDTTDHAYDFNLTGDLTPPSAAGEVAYDTLTFTDGADMDSVVAHKYFILRVNNPATVGTDLGADSRLFAIIMAET